MAVSADKVTQNAIMPTEMKELHSTVSFSVGVFLSAVNILQLHSLSALTVQQAHSVNERSSLVCCLWLLLQLLSRLSTLQAHSINERKGQQACAECLGTVGAVDPARVSLQTGPPPRLAAGQHALLVALLTDHLVRLLRVAPSLQVLDAASVAIQVDSKDLADLLIGALVPCLLGMSLH